MAKENGASSGEELNEKKVKESRTEVLSEDELERLAVAAIMQEAKRGKARAEQTGPKGWYNAPKANKRFLNNMMMGAMSSNRKLSEVPERRVHTKKQKLMPIGGDDDKLTYHSSESLCKEKSTLKEK